MKIAIDTCAITNGDIDFSKFNSLGEIIFFENLQRQELLELVSDADALIINKIVIDEELLAKSKKLKYVGTFATGYNIIDIDACNRHGVVVCNVPDYSTYAVAQHTFALLLNLYNKIYEYSPSVNRGDWVKSETFCYFPWETHELYKKTFGIYGYGNIGKATAKIAQAFGCEVIVCSRTKKADCPFEQVDFDTLLSRSDILSLHCPLTSKTERIINAQTLKKMKSTAVLINTARGGLVDEEALANALNSGELYGACLDTVAVEPMLKDNRLLNARNCIITPHMAWVAHDTRSRLVGIAFENLKCFLSGNPQNKVN